MSNLANVTSVKSLKNNRQPVSSGPPGISGLIMGKVVYTMEVKLKLLCHDMKAYPRI